MGRHSLMNGDVWPVKVKDQSEEENRVREILDFVHWQQELYDFGAVQARTLFDSELSLQSLGHVAITKWREVFPASRDASKEAWRGLRRFIRERAKARAEEAVNGHLQG